MPQFWQFIQGLRSDDILVELIQNDLDANASCTSITFASDRLICQGDGEPVSADGWARLSYLMGAGVEVERKRSRIGVKNHGLKACFLLGDEIILRSDGHRMVQALYKDGHDQYPSPNTLLEPVPDSDAAPVGCSIEVPYRQRQLQVTRGEDLTIGIPDASLLEDLFTDACESLPERLLGVVRPGIRNQYTVRLSHHTLGSVEIHWRAKRKRNLNTRSRRQLTLFSRECITTSDTPGVPSGATYERACIFRLPFPSGRRQEIPDFFSIDRRSFWAEIAWLTNKRGTPKPIQGVRRYPIGYGTSSEAGLSGVGVHFSGPYVSDSARHGTSHGHDLNAYIDNACKDALVDVMSSDLLHRHGGRTMELYMANPDDAEDEILADLVERTIDKRALPLAHRVSRKSRRTKRIPLGPRIRSDGTLRRVVLPMFNGRISPLLAEICPRNEDQIDRSVPAPILSCLANRMIKRMDTITFDEMDVVTFDENDVIARLQPELEAEYFPWNDDLDWQTTLGNPSVAKIYLDVLHDSVQRGELESEEETKENIFLPDEGSRARPLIEMFSAVNLPPNLGHQEYVPILHPELQGHRLFRKYAWKLKPYKLEDFLDRAKLETAPLVERESFWAWLRDNWRTVNSRKVLNRTAALPIWPSAAGDLWPLNDLCEPRNARVASIIDNAIVRPSRELLTVGFVRRTGRGHLLIRSTPSLQEFEEYLVTQIDRFPRGQELTVDEQMEFHKLEKDLAVLASTAPQLRQYLVDLGKDHSTALDMDGTLRNPCELARGTGSLKHLHLPNKHLIDRPNRALDRIDGWKPRTAPSTEQIVDAFREDGSRFEAHLPRLREYVKQSRREFIDPDGLHDVRCIPVEGELRTPNQIALRGQRDYWGDWKLQLPVADINAEAQRLYKSIGVAGGTPDATSSRMFFRWLASQNSETIDNHVAQVLRHIDHESGPKTWSVEFPDVPFILVECDGGSVRLVTKAEATGRRSKVVIPDFEELQIAIREHAAKRPVEMAIVDCDRVSDPISARLRQFGLRTLRDYAGTAAGAVGTGNTSLLPSKQQFLDILDSLRTGPEGRQLRKRLAKRDFDARDGTLKSNWRAHLPPIRDIRTADDVTAIYRLGRNRYKVPVDGQLDRESDTLWIKSDSDPQTVFFDVVAEHVFDLPKRYYGSILHQAFTLKMTARYSPRHSGRSHAQESADANDGPSQYEGYSDPVLTSARHTMAEPDPMKNIPDPGPIPQGSGVIKRVSKANQTNGRPQSADEDAQKADLKENQYAWHCQACLAEAEPKTLAPPSSYVEGSKNRRWIIEAHHCDHVVEGGARHAGNIIVLCRHHHGALGDAIGRTEITQALSHAANRRLTFDSDNGASSSVQGKIVVVRPAQRQAPVSLFFTRQHADYWLEKAREEDLI